MTILRLMLSLLLWTSLFQPLVAQDLLYQIAPPDRQLLAQQDREQPGNRFAAPVGLSLRTTTHGQWGKLVNGRAEWTLHLRAAGTPALALFLDELALPADGRLDILTADGQVQATLTQQSAPPAGRYFSGFLLGEVVHLRYTGSKPAAGQSLFRIWRADYVYRPEQFATFEASKDGFGTSAACQIDAACLTDTRWADADRAVCRITVVVEEGTGFCTGTLLNNTAQDGTPYVLTGFHCQDGYTPIYDMWQFDFGYALPSCAPTTTEPARDPLRGSTLRAGRRENDFLLLEITDTRAAQQSLFFAGWSRAVGTINGGVALFHHPVGDVLKVSTSTLPVAVFGGGIDWNNNVTTPPSHHYSMTFSTGSFEIGSSGAALFDEQQRVRGQLHGGAGDCVASTLGYFGRLSLSWTGGGTPNSRLRDWLDPLGADPTTLDGLDQTPITARVQRPDGTPLQRVRIDWTAAGAQGTTTTDAQGRYTLPQWPVGTSVQLRLSRDDAPEAGVSVSDIIAVRRHILGFDTLSVYAQLAGDVNASGGLSTSDVISLRRLILGFDAAFPARPTWIFVPADRVITPELMANTTLLTDPNFSVTTANWPPVFVGVKTGDVNGSVSGE